MTKPTDDPTPQPDQPADPGGRAPQGGEPQRGELPEPPHVATEKRLRHERRQATERAEQAEQALARLQRRVVERAAAKELQVPADFWVLSGDDLSPWLTDDGEVDADRVRQHAHALRVERPGLALHVQRRDPDAGRGNGTIAPGSPIGDWMRRDRR
ncbi:MAG: hypothetical protein ACRDYU_07995 [Actinomycetes bacterium]